MVEVAHVDPEKTAFVQQLQGRFPPRLDESSGAFRVIRLACEAPSAMPPLVRADRNRILQVLYNLIDNALKFTPAGGSISVRCESSDHGVQFSITDTGRGIEESNLGRIFERYWQAKATAHLGSGLGLAIAKAIVEQHGGAIWVESKLGIGSTFFFTLVQNNGSQRPGDQERIA